MSMHIGQSLVSPAVAEGQLLVIEPKLVENRGVDVVNQQRILDHPIAEVIRLAKREASPKTTTRQEDRVAIHVMIAACSLGDGGGVRGSPHLTRPDDDRRFE
jgi:hypothetical protein